MSGAWLVLPTYNEAENLEPIVENAAGKDRLLMIDMESHRYIDATLEVFARAYARSPHVGVAIQSYLRRSEQDIFRLPEGCQASQTSLKPWLTMLRESHSTRFRTAPSGWRSWGLVIMGKSEATKGTCSNLNILAEYAFSER